MADRIGRYELHDQLAAGGMGAVYFGRLVGPAGFSRPVAVKRMHPRLAADPSFVRMFVDEAHITARIRHPNVVSVLDVIAQPGELLLVMEHIHGVSLSQLQRLTESIPAAHCAAIAVAALAGLHAAHEARDEQGEPLGIVHQDVSPQNVLVGSDGVARVLDFGIAVASALTSADEHTPLRGKLGYLAPEQLRGEAADRRADLYAMGVVLWEMLSGRHLVPRGDRTAADVLRMSSERRPAPSQFCKGLPAEVDAVCLRALSPSPEERFASAREMALALSRALAPTSTIEMGDYIERVAAEPLAQRQRQVAAIEAGTLLRIDVAGTVAAADPVAAIAAELPGAATETDLSLQLMMGSEGQADATATMPMQPTAAAQSANPAETELTGAQLVSSQPAAGQSSARSGRRWGLLLAGLAVAAGGVALAAASPQSQLLQQAFTRQWLALNQPSVARSAAASASAAVASASASSVIPAPQRRPFIARPARLRASPPPPATTPPKGRCNPPFEIDARGDKRFKPGCF